MDFFNSSWLINYDRMITYIGTITTSTPVIIDEVYLVQSLEALENDLEMRPHNRF